jgi:hypothetical protein
VYRVEQTVASVSGLGAGILVLRETKCNNAKVCVMGNGLGETTPRNELGLDYASDDHDANSGMETMDLLHKFHPYLPIVHY